MTNAVPTHPAGTRLGKAGLEHQSVCHDVRWVASGQSRTLSLTHLTAVTLAEGAPPTLGLRPLRREFRPCFIQRSLPASVRCPNRWDAGGVGGTPGWDPSTGGVLTSPSGVPQHPRRRAMCGRRAGTCRTEGAAAPAVTGAASPRLLRPTPSPKYSSEAFSSPRADDGFETDSDPFLFEEPAPRKRKVWGGRGAGAGRELLC